MSYRYPIGCLVFSWLSCAIGLTLGYIISDEWFGRFGAVMVFFAVASEYALVQMEMKTLYETIREKSAFWHDHGWGDVESTRFHKISSMSAHITVGLGTLVWGFGDWLLACIKSA